MADVRTLQAMVINALSEHLGAENGITAVALAARLGCTPRALRKAISAAREQGTAIGAHPATGYYIANTPEELERSIAFLRQRALHSLRLLHRMGASIPDLVGQLHITA